MKTKTTHEPSREDLDALIAEAEQLTAEPAGAAEQPEGGHPPSTAATSGRSKAREAAVTLAGTAGGLTAGRAASDALARKKVIEVAKRVASRKTAGMSDQQVLEFLQANEGFRRSLVGHLHEQLDAEALKRIYEARKRLGLPEGWYVELYSKHNNTARDGVVKGARNGRALFLEYKASQNPQQMRKAASKAARGSRAKTGLVAPRGVKKTLSTRDVAGLKDVRDAGLSLKQMQAMVDKAANPAKVTQAGTKAAGQLTLRASAGAALLGAGISAACDANKVRKGEMTPAEAAENAAWAGGEATACTVAAAGATVAAAPTLAAGATILAGSSVAGTTALAAGLTVLGPIGVGIGTSLAVGYGVKKLRTTVRS